MRLRRLIKKNAALALRRNWSKAAAISLIILVVWSFFTSAEQAFFAVFDIPPFVDMATVHTHLDDIPNVAMPAMAVTMVLGFVYLLVMTPISLGSARWFYNLTDGRVLPVYEMFDSFTEFGKFSKALWLWILLFLKKTLWSLLFLAPPAAMTAMGEYWRRESSRDIETLLSVGLEVLGVVLFILMGWFLLIWLRRYSLAKYVVAEYQDISAWKAVKYSVRLTRDRKTELLVLELSLIGWRILDLLVLPRLFTMPYIATIYALYTRYLVEMDKMEREKAAAVKAEKKAHQQVRQQTEPLQDNADDRSEQDLPNQQQEVSKPIEKNSEQAAEETVKQDVETTEEESK